jgi:hypothetical protein
VYLLIPQNQFRDLKNIHQVIKHNIGEQDKQLEQIMNFMDIKYMATKILVLEVIILYVIFYHKLTRNILIMENQHEQIQIQMDEIFVKYISILFMQIKPVSLSRITLPAQRGDTHRK